MSEEWITEMSKPDLLARIRKDRAEFAALWADLTPQQMTVRPAVQDDWSVKDLIAHLTWWEQYAVLRVPQLLAGAQPVEMPLEERNALTFEENKDRALEDVLADFAASEKQVEALIDGLTDEQINANINDDFKLLYLIIGNTFGHLNDHRADLMGYLDSLKG